MMALRAARGAMILGRSVIAAEGVASADVELSRYVLAEHEPDVLTVEREGGPFPVRLCLRADGIGNVGWLLLGPRPDDSLIGKDERDVLTEIGDPLARALFVATERKATLAAAESRFAAIERLLAELEGRMRPAQERESRAG